MSKDAEHVIVVGAGIVGVSTAIWLQRAGLKVTLIDREGPASATSYGNAGILAASAVVPVTEPGILKKAPRMLFDPNEPLFLKWSYLPKLLPFLVSYLGHANHKDMKRIASGLAGMMHDTADQHVALAKGTEAEKFIQTGDYLFVYRDEKYYRKDRLAWDTRKRNGVEFEELDASALDEYQPALAGKFGFGVRCPNHGQINDPGEYTKALAKHFEDEGGEIRIAEITDIRIENGKAIGVELQGGMLDADQIVVTMGAWSGKLAKRLGAKIPVEAERGYHVEFVGADVQLSCPVMITPKKFAMTSMNGRLRCAGIVEFGGLEAGPSRAPFELIKRNAKEIFPDMKYERIDEWMGHRPSTPDSLPLVGAFRNVPNVWAGFGHQHLGLTGGPKTGRWLAQMISGDKPNVDMAPYSPDRF
ncbi:MAG: FAD-dependent oxidoreductase [Pseudomonadota bacterium]